MRQVFWLGLLGAGCALNAAAPPPSALAPATEVSAVAATPSSPPTEEVAIEAPFSEDDDVGEEDEAVAEEAESREPDAAADGALRYTTDLADADLAEKWANAPEALGSISIGFADEGRLVNAERFPRSEEWILVSPDRAFATRETVEYVTAAIREVRAQFPHAPRLRVNQMSLPEGGYVRPHKSHQSGRDVDLGFYYPTEEPVKVREREKVIDVALNWALLRALIVHGDVQFILLDRRVQKVLYAHALAIGEDPVWLDSLFRAGKRSLVQHARRHRDHFHVRYFNPRAQELGRRVAPLLAQRPEQNIAMHKVRRGDTLGAIARRYNSTVRAIQKANKLRNTFLRVSRVLKVPMRGPCTRCPIPPPVVVPPRRLPPSEPVAAADVMPLPGGASR
ncbi:MAG: penicillin-insensitive murein endopeptidase [Myxococcota bacterium]